MSTRKERRQSRRISTEIELSVAGLDSLAAGARARNLSAGGAYLDVSRALAPLSKLEVDLVLPPWANEGEDAAVPRRIRTEAIVVRCEPDSGNPGRFQVGIAFLNMSQQDRRRLEDYIEWRLTRSILESVESSGPEA